MSYKIVSGNVVDIEKRTIYPGEIVIVRNRIKEIRRTPNKRYSKFILPGFIDSHIHIESSMVSPLEFSKWAARSGTVGVVSDPHEIANVCGLKGIDYMIKNGRKGLIKFFFGAPSCVPATSFETSGAKLGPENISSLLKRKDIYFLSEMMNFPGVIFNDKEVLAKIASAKKFKKPIDGHAPGLKGKDLMKYYNSGISTDHEALNYHEALEKIKLGMIIQIREGSASKHFDELCPLIDKYPDRVMLCSDDLHPEDLIKGHIQLLVKRGVKKGLNIFNILQAAILNPINHYKLKIGLLKKNDSADFVIVNNLSDFKILSTYVEGNEIFNSKGVKKIKETVDQSFINNFQKYTLSKPNVKIANSGKLARIISIKDKQLFTGSEVAMPLVKNNEVIPDQKNDVLKIVITNRYRKTKPAVGLIKNFGIRYGAVAASIAHDSHNIVAIGTNDADLVNAINAVMKNKGGIAWNCKRKKLLLPLPIAGLMSNRDAKSVAEKYQQIQEEIRKAGSILTSPLMTMSFLSLLVIPELKIGDKGLFDVSTFKAVKLFV